MRVSFLLGLLAVSLVLLAQAQPQDPSSSGDIRIERIPAPGTAIAQDAQGFMWFGGKSGLSKYDGYTLTHYRPDPEDTTSLSNILVECLYVDRDGTLWVGTTGGGLDRFDPATETFTHYRHDPNDATSLSDNVVRAIYEDRAGTLWIGTGDLSGSGLGGGLNRFDRETGTFTRYLHDSDDPRSLSDNEVRVIYEDRAGTLWIGTGDFADPGLGGGLNRFDPATETFTRYLHDPDDSNSLTSNRVQTLLEDSRGTFWVGTRGDGLHSLDRETGVFTHYPYDPNNRGRLSAPHRRDSHITGGVSFVHEDRHGVLWVGSWNGGLNRYDPATGILTYFDAADEDLFYNFGLFRIYESRDGTLWVGSWTTNGIHKLVPNTDVVRHFTLDQGLSNGHVRAIEEEASGMLWVATDDGLNRFDPATDTFIYFRHDPADPNSLSSDSLSVVYEAPSEPGVLWVGTMKLQQGWGLNRFDPDTGQVTRYRHNPDDPNSLSDDRVWSVLEDSRGRLWVGTYGGGLNQLDRASGTFTFYQHNPDDPNSLSDDRVRALYEVSTQPGTLWMATGIWGFDTGLDRFDVETGVFTRYLPEASVSSFYEDTSGRFWVGTSSGLYRLDPETGEHTLFEGEAGLLDLNVVGILEDDAGYLWLSQARNLTQFDPQEGIVVRSIEVPSAAYGFWQEAAQKRRDGTLVFGTWDAGFYTLSPAPFGAEVLPPEVALTGLKVFNEPVMPGKDAPLQTPISHAEEIVLDHTQNDFTMEFVGLHYQDQSTVQYAYLLEGFDADWVQTRTQRSARYSRIPPGTYNFRVKASHSGGVWNEEEGSLRITILPPWWRTWWAYALYGLLLMAGVFGVYRWQHARIVRGEQEKAHKVLEEAHTQLDASHHQLQETHQHLKATQQQLIQSEKMASLGQLTAGIAHEIKNPLNFVNNFAEVNEELARELKELITDNRERRIAEVLEDLDDIASGMRLNSKHIAQHGKRADRIVQSMMEHATGGPGERYDVGVNKLIDEYVTLSYRGMQAQVPDLKVAIDRQYDETVGTVEMAPQELGRALLNVLNNAFEVVHQRAQAEGGSYRPMVKVLTRLLDGQVEIRVCDNGPGIPREIKDRIFEPFFTTKPTGSGTGLGLSLSYDIVTQGHGGTLTVESTEGEGATFIITLPNSLS